MGALDSVDNPFTFYEAIAPGYDELFRAPHRLAYDTLAWEIVHAALPPTPSQIIDIGCGTGRWAEWLVRQGYTVVAVEPSTAMANIARARIRGTRFHVIESCVENVNLPLEQADVILALGSLQYACDPARVLSQISRWLRPGGTMHILVDSLVSLVLELRAAGKHDEADVRLETRRASWRVQGRQVSYHLYDATRLQGHLCAAGLEQIVVRGILIGWNLFGSAQVLERLQRDFDAHLATERLLTSQTALADLGKHLLVSARKPPR